MFPVIFLTHLPLGCGQTRVVAELLLTRRLGSLGALLIRALLVLVLVGTTWLVPMFIFVQRKLESELEKAGVFTA